LYERNTNKSNSTCSRQLFDHQGRQLAIKMSRLIVKATQPDAAVREKLRPMYAEDPAMLIGICQAVATEFATIAAANNYWR
jgi:glycerate-2-kinase